MSQRSIIIIFSPGGYFCRERTYSPWQPMRNYFLHDSETKGPELPGNQCYLHSDVFCRSKSPRTQYCITRRERVKFVDMFPETNRFSI